jgi:hypothetical protein
MVMSGWRKLGMVAALGIAATAFGCSSSRTAPPPDDPPVMPPSNDETPATPAALPAGNCLQFSSGDDYKRYGEFGPYEVATMTVTVGDTNQQYTVFYPQPFEENCAHPIAVWGNATGVPGNEKYAFLNVNAASWGVVVAAAHTTNAYDADTFTLGIDWLLAQNEDPTSVFHHRLSPRAAVAGHEQAGIGASRGSAHPNVEAVVAIMGNAEKELREGVAYACLTGSEDVLSRSGCTSAFETAQGPAFLASWEGGTAFTPTSQYYIARDAGTIAIQRVYAAWLRCFLSDEPHACALFRGEPCGLCEENGWARAEARNM